MIVDLFKILKRWSMKYHRIFCNKIKLILPKNSQNRVECILN